MTTVAGSGKIEPLHLRIYYTCWMTVVAPTDHTKLVRNFCVIVFVGSLCYFDNVLSVV